MANVCFNWVQIFGNADALEKVKQNIDEDWYLNSETNGELLCYSVESRWSPPKEELKELSKEFGVVIECEYDECGCDLWGKFGFNNGELVFDIDLPYLEGKYNSMNWGTFIECEVLHRFDDDETIDDFLEQFYFCNETELSELKEMYLNN